MTRAGLPEAIEVAEAFHKLGHKVAVVAEDLPGYHREVVHVAWDRVEALSDTELQELKAFYDLAEANGIDNARSINEDLANIVLERQLEAVA